MNEPTSRRSQTGHILRRTAARVRVTRRHHPLQGEDVEVLIEGRGQHLVVQLPDGSSMRIPRAWTDADGAAEPPERITIFTVRALRELIEIAGALRTARDINLPAHAEKGRE